MSAPSHLLRALFAVLATALVLGGAPSTTTNGTEAVAVAASSDSLIWG
ncbi:hypothetical protein [Streptomyces violarus]|uniref:Uncharacterized protein n=1 Tax=Streptomyces violarus TaxID=67380 RepID=A0A7W4ZQE8_9ACTN|nr:MULTISPECIES: hypothetical protein [Streptomyces]MBB3076760.1 hypothetical protein [Streptomyces violarus]WRU01572.1 hypothetical protein VJ737_29570 [Streptomyces sp. CGMCC 4.1772]